MEIMNLGKITSRLKKPGERFLFEGEQLDFSIVEFWQWNQSDLVENRNRGILAEFLVKKALGINNVMRVEWDANDLITEDGVKIEVKSCAFIQAWSQSHFSQIIFNIAPTKELLPDNNYSEEKSRQADIYIFCLLHHKDQETINPMDLDQWTFYLVATKTLNSMQPPQTTLSLNTLKRLEHEECGFGNLREKFDLIKDRIF